MAQLDNPISQSTRRRARLRGSSPWLSRFFYNSSNLKTLIILGLSTLIILSLIIAVVQNGVSGIWRYVLGVLLLLGFASILSFAALLVFEIVQALRRGQSFGSLQRRLVFFFILMAIIPTMTVAIFSTLTLNLGVEGWFSDQVKNAVETSDETARAYQEEHRNLLIRDGETVYNALSQSLGKDRNFGAGLMRGVLNQAVSQTVNISHAFLIEGTGEIYVRGDHSYEFNYVIPTARELARAHQGEVVIIEDQMNNQFRYLRVVDVSGFNRYLLLSRPVDGKILALLDQTEETAAFYRDLESSRLRLTLLYAAVFLVVALLILFIAISVALYLAGRLTRPINQLVRAVARLGDGELDVRVPVSSEYDEFAVLSRNFNSMTDEMRQKQNQLKMAGNKSERERRRFNSVLEGVSSGVLGVNQKGQITFINPAAEEILATGQIKANPALKDIAPEFLPLIEEAQKSHEDVFQSQVILVRNTVQETVFVRVARQKNMEGFIISFDDVSNLVHAQRMAAWGDVARRIAHEIKNPLTPIRLSAERMQRRYGDQIDDTKFNEMTQIIIRQTEDLRRIVDEFSRFSKMREPEFMEGDLVASLKDAMTLQSQDDVVEIDYSGPNKLPAIFDASLMGQAFGNLLKNAREAIESDPIKEKKPKILVHVEDDDLDDNGYATIKIIDNGIGLPKNRSRIFEPYVTMKETGTGLGLPIVKKILEDHGGSLQLLDREDHESGACALIRFPILNRAPNKGI